MRALLVACTALVAWSGASALEVSHVRHTPALFDPARGEEATVELHLSEPAEVRLELYDGRDLRVGVVEAGRLEAGDHALSWDGTAVTGETVPPEAYTYRIVARADAGPPVVWDVSGQSGGDVLDPGEASWDPDTGEVRYRLETPARVRVRIGLANQGPLLRTLVDWVPRAAGAHAEPWDGRDASDVLDLARHPNLVIVPEAFALPRNTLLVGPPPRTVALLDGIPEDAPRRDAEPPRRRRMYDFASQPIEERSDYPLLLRAVGEVERNAAGDPVVSGPTPFRIDVPTARRTQVLEERCEAVFFVDGQFVFEREVGFLPMTWTWTPRGASPGVHHITANLRGYEGHFGMSTLRVVLAADGDEEQP